MCTLLGKSRSGAALLVSNSDDPYAIRNQLVCASATPYAYVAVRVVTEGPETGVPWNRMLTRGINSAGLAFTYAYVHEPGNETPPPQRWPEALLAECADVAAGVEFIQRRVGEVLSGNYLLADRSATVAAVEISQTRVSIRHPEGGLLVCTNQWERLPMQAPDRWGAQTARERFSRGKALFERDTADLADGFRAARDHVDRGRDADRSYGISICNHGRVEGTISSEVADPARSWLWWTYGWPCGAARGYEALSRVPWGRYVAFDAGKVSADGEVTTLDGLITPLGIGLLAAVESG